MGKKINRELLESRRKGWDNLQVGLFLKSDGLITNNLRLSNKVLGERMFEIEKGGGGQDKAIKLYKSINISFPHQCFVVSSSIVVCPYRDSLTRKYLTRMVEE